MIVLTTTDDSAMVSDDFAGEGFQRISFSIGEERETARISLFDDFIPEPTEQFFVGIEQPENGFVVPFASTRITVIDTDSKCHTRSWLIITNKVQKSNFDFIQ